MVILCIILSIYLFSYANLYFIVQNSQLESPFILCLDTSAHLEPLHERVATLEASLDASLSVVLIDPKKLRLACYHVLCSYSKLDESDVTSWSALQLFGLPSPFKIHNSLTKVLTEKKFSDPLATLLIAFTPSRSLTVQSSNEERTELNMLALWRALDDSHLYATTNQFDFGSFANIRQQSTYDECLNSPEIDEEDIVKIHKNSIEISVEKFQESRENFVCLGRLIERLTREERVTKVAVGSRPKPLNFEARGISQAGYSMTPWDTPLSDVGLTGLDEVVGVADTGVDDLHCFFYDDSGMYSSSTTERSLITSESLSEIETELTVQPNRRKIVAYAYNVDSDETDQLGGHGSHVTGSVAGKCLQKDAQRSNGNAHEAKISFFDIGTPLIDAHLFTL